MAKKYTATKKQWEANLNALKATEGGLYVFPQGGQTKVRMLLSPEREIEDFYQPVLRMFKNNSTTRFMIPVLVIDDSGNINNEIRYLVTAKTVIKAILTILSGGEYDLLHPENGHSIVINRTGEGLNTEYSVLPSKAPVAVDYEVLDFEHKLIDLTLEMEASDREDKEEDDIPF